MKNKINIIKELRESLRKVKIARTKSRQKAVVFDLDMEEAMLLGRLKDEMRKARKLRGK